MVAINCRRVGLKIPQHYFTCWHYEVKSHRESPCKACHAGAVDAAELGAELSRAFSAHPFLSTNKGSRMVMRILEVKAHPACSSVCYSQYAVAAGWLDNRE